MGRSSPQKFKALKRYVINIVKKSEFEKSRIAYKEKGGKYKLPEITAKVKIKSTLGYIKNEQTKPNKDQYKKNIKIIAFTVKCCVQLFFFY